MNNLGDLGLEKESEMLLVNELLCFILWTSEIGAGRRSGPVVRACGQGSQLWRPGSDEPGGCGEPRPVRSVTPGAIQASLEDWLSVRLPQRLGQQSDTETWRCTEIKGKSKSLIQRKL